MATKKKKQVYNVGGQIGQTAGTYIGQTLIPIPGVGAAIGGIGGKLIGDTIGDLFTKKKRKRLEEQQKLDLIQDRAADLYGSVGISEYASGGKIRIKPENRGKFTASANRAGMGVQAYARKVLADPNAPGYLKKRANFARNAAKWKKADGGEIIMTNPTGGNYYAYSLAPVGKKKKRMEDRGPIDDLVKYLVQRYTPAAKKVEAKAKRFAKEYAPVVQFGEDLINKWSQVASSGLGYANIDFNEPQPKPPTLERRIMETQREIAEKPYSGVPTKFKAKGGVLPIKGGNDARKVVGPKHERGGVNLSRDIEVEGGETLDNVRLNAGGKVSFVFSDRIKFPGSQASFADVHKRAVNTSAGDAFINRLAQVQESVKDDDYMDTTAGQESKLQYPRRKWQDGGKMSPYSYGLPDTSKLPYAAPPAVSSASLSGASNLFGKAAGFLTDNADLIPGVYNLATGLFGKQKPAQVNPESVSRKSLGYLRRLPTSVNVSPQLNAIAQNFRTVFANPNASSAERLASQAQSTQSRLGVLANKENIENQLKSQQLSALSEATGRFDLYDSQNRNQADYFNAQNQALARAAKSNLIGTGLGQISDTIQMRQQEKALMAMEPVRLAIALAGLDKSIQNRILDRLQTTAPDKFKSVFEILNGN